MSLRAGMREDQRSRPCERLHHRVAVHSSSDKGLATVSSLTGGPFATGVVPCPARHTRSQRPGHVPLGNYSSRTADAAPPGRHPSRSCRSDRSPCPDEDEPQPFACLVSDTKTLDMKRHREQSWKIPGGLLRTSHRGVGGPRPGLGEGHIRAGGDDGVTAGP